MATRSKGFAPGCVLPPNLRHKSLSKFQPGQLDKLTGLLFDA
jgi:hypothetical protein